MRDPLGLRAPAVNRADERGQRIAGGWPHPIAGDQQARRFDQWQPFGAGKAVQLLHGGAADAAPRRVQNALEGEIVGGLIEKPQISERIADLLPFVKPRPADHAIGQRERNEAVFELARLEPGAHQDRDFAERMPLALQCLDLVADPAGFLLGIPYGPDDDLFALVSLGPQGLAEAAAILRDNAARRPEDVRRRAVVLLEPRDRRAREILLEAQDVADLGAAPAVDRLVVVADTAQISAPLRQQTQP